ncbi:MAG: hypothetical protein WAW17_17250 [Rhodococcus sp. (in: high G+C Gram-positive bacteria)]|uniref:hypothetical protein n=1 Tax=Rhodococcus sp. TaxID=1831 RepID=UPI003BB1D17E
MSQSVPDPEGFETVDERRARITFHVREWCERAQMAGSRPELSDDAAVLIAAGHLGAATRQVLMNRRAAGRGIPTIGGFGALRALSEEYGRTLDRLATLRPGPAQLLVKYRVTELGRRLQAVRSAVVMSSAHYAAGVRAIRRDRRDGVHLDLDQRETLFRALQQTPAPITVSALERAGKATRAVMAERLTEASGKTAAAALGRRVAEAIGRGVDMEHERFADRYDTLLFMAGTLFDRIEGSAVWHSQYFSVQRHQLDLAQELMQIAVDTVALRGIVHELHDALGATLTEAGREQVQLRQRALKPVWDQLLDRVAALARIGDLLSQAEQQLRSVMAVNRAQSLDSRIDELLARSGDRELSAENTHYVGDQFDGVEELMLTYQSVLYGDIAELTTRPAKP